MNIVYLADTQIPSRATNGIQIMRMCEAFAAEGSDVTLVHPHRFGNRPEGYDGDVWAFYGVSETFNIVTLPTPLTLRLSAYRRFARAVRGLPALVWLIARTRPGAPPFVVYSRSLAGVWLSQRVRKAWVGRSSCRGVFVEMHDGTLPVNAQKLLAGVDGVIAISAALAHDLVEAVPGIAKRIRVEHDGVDRRLLSIPIPEGARVRCRNELGLPSGALVVGYTGRLTAGKGAGCLIEAAALLRDHPTIRFLLVGKAYQDFDVRRTDGLANVVRTGFVPPSEVALYLAASDILVMPSSQALPYARFTSPLKLFEYMASGRPVICSDLPVLREVLTHEVNALLIPPDSPPSLASAIETLASDGTLRSRLAERARQDAMRYTWDARAVRILEMISVPLRG